MAEALGLHQLGVPRQVRAEEAPVGVGEDAVGLAPHHEGRHVERLEVRHAALDQRAEGARETRHQRLLLQRPEHRDPQVVIDHIRDIGRPWGIDVTLKDPEADQLSDTGEDTWICAVEFFGPDRPGLLRQMASRFALEGISIIELHGRRNEEDDEVNMKLELAVPDSCSPDVVYNFIQDLQESTQLQTRIHPARSSRKSRFTGHLGPGEGSLAASRSQDPQATHKS